MQCPGCRVETTSQTLDGHYGRTVTLDWCASCHALWFDTNESIVLTPGAVLRLFGVIHAGKPEAPVPLPAALACPRCRRRLELTQDIAFGTRFHYFRCPADHGRLITAAEFLREKRFVRPLGPTELAELRRHVQMIQCSSCGAPVDLGAGSACGHCRAPVSMLDPDQVQKTIKDLQEAEKRRTTEDPALAARLLADRLEVDRLFRHEAARAGGLTGFGLVEVGLAAVAGILSSLD